MLKAISELLLPFLLLVAAHAVSFADAPAFRDKIVFFGNTVDGRQRIESTALDATRLQTLCELPQGTSVLPGRISPDGRTLAFTLVTKESPRPALWLWEHGSERKKLSDNVTWVCAWSPNSERIAGFDGDADGRFASFTIDVATGRRTKIDLPETDRVDDWSPNGRTLLATLGNPTRSYVRADGEEYPLRALISLDVSGERRTPITTDPQGDYIWPRYSPDGTQVAFYARYHRNGKTAEYAMIAGADGSNARELACFTSLDNDELIKPNGAPCWAPDGRTIFFKVIKRPQIQDGVGADQTRFELAALASDGSGTRRIPLSTERSWWGFIDCR